MVIWLIKPLQQKDSEGNGFVLDLYYRYFYIPDDAFVMNQNSSHCRSILQAPGKYLVLV